MLSRSRQLCCVLRQHRRRGCAGKAFTAPCLHAFHPPRPHSHHPDLPRHLPRTSTIKHLATQHDHSAGALRAVASSPTAAHLHAPGSSHNHTPTCDHTAFTLTTAAGHSAGSRCRRLAAAAVASSSCCEQQNVAVVCLCRCSCCDQTVRCSWSSLHMAPADTQQHMASALLEAAKQGDIAQLTLLLPDGETVALVAAAKAVLAAGQHKPASVLLHAVGRREQPALLEAMRSLGQDTPSKVVVELTGELAGLLQGDVEALNKEADGVKRGDAGLCILAKLLRLDVQQAEAVKVLSDGGAAAAAGGGAAGRSTEAEAGDGDRMQQ